MNTVSSARTSLDVVKQHVDWINAYAKVMTENNWRDMKTMIERQSEELTDALKRIVVAPITGQS
jgi:hypothetical protein